MKDIARPDIKPAFAERNVPVALATDENYLPYLKVTINSAIASSPGSNLDIIVLHAGITEDAIRTFVAGYAGAGHATVRFVDVSEELKTSGLSDYIAGVSVKNVWRQPKISVNDVITPH